MALTPQQEQDFATLRKEISEAKMQDVLFNLYCRWQDEKDYEDFKDYEKVMKDALPKHIKFIKATKLPWGFKYSFGKHVAHYQMRTYAQTAKFQTVLKLNKA